jgi:hypothetical protein
MFIPTDKKVKSNCSYVKADITQAYTDFLSGWYK